MTRIGIILGSTRRLRAASARSAGGGPQITGWFMGPTLTAGNITGVKSV